MAATAVGRQVSVITTSQASGAAYTVTVDGTVQDVLGRGIDPAAASASFSGFACTTAQVVISQVYGGGGSAGATYANDFVELHNRAGTAVTLTGWSLQYAVGAGTTWTAVPIDLSIQAGGYALVQLGSSGSAGVALPTPQVTSTLNVSASSGKVALVSGATAISGACPTDPGIIDLVGYGTASCFEGAHAAQATSATVAVLRGAGGCDDTNDNAADFTTAAPSPRNDLTAPVTCACP